MSARETVDAGAPARDPRAGSHRERSPVVRRERSAVSVVVPVSERPEALDDLYREYSAPLRRAGHDFEFIFVLEPWHSDLARPLARLAEEGAAIRTIESGRSLGEAGLLNLAAGHCREEIVLTLPAYHRVQPESLPRLVARVEAGGVDLAVARRSPRRDAWINRLQGRIFHGLLGLAGGKRFHDVACGVRAMRRELLENLPLYGDHSRFLPLFAAQGAFRVEEVDCAQHPEDRHTRVYAPGTYLRRAIDLIGVFFLLRFTDKPLRFFGLLGSGLSLAGGTILLALLVQRLGGQAIADRPLLLLGVLLFTLGVQVVALGLVGELIVHLHAGSRPRYRLRPTPRSSS